jgi:hypothetical protein
MARAVDFDFQKAAGPNVADPVSGFDFFRAEPRPRLA